MTNRLVDARELAQVLGVSPRLIQRMAQQGRIPSFVVGDRLLRFDLHAVLQAMTSKSRDLT